MLLFSVEQLENQGVTYQELVEATQIKCSGRVYSRVCNFPPTERESAMEACRRFIKEGIFSFVSDSSVYLTVWREHKQDISVEYKSSFSFTSINKTLDYEVLTKETVLSTNIKEIKKEEKNKSDYQIYIRKSEDSIDNQVKSNSIENYSPANPQSDEKLTQKANVALEKPQESNSRKSTRVYRGIAY